MGYKIQIVVDARFNRVMKLGAKKVGLSVSSFARLILTTALLHKHSKLLDQALSDIKKGDVEELTVAQFNRELDEL